MDEHRTTPEQRPAHPTRRFVLTALGLGAAGGLGAACAPNQAQPAGAAADVPAPACVLAPEAIEGPYYIDRDLVRSDIVEDRGGIPVTLRLRIVDAAACTALQGAAVDIWHCDARGYYSGHLDLDPNTAPMPDPHVDPTDPSTFLRGTQISDRDGNVQFRTIHPGWYFGRAIHIHVMVHAGGKRVHTGQLYFPEDLNTRIERTPGYTDRPLQRVTNETDFLFQQEGGPQSTLAVEPAGQDVGAGHTASIILGVNPAVTPPPATFSPPR